MEIILQNKKLLAGSFIFLTFYLLRKYYNGPKTNLKKDMSNKTIIVTGSSDGIGKETALQLLRDGATVIFATRDENKTLKIINSIKNEEQRKRAIYINLDLSKFNSVINFANTFKSKFDKLDILINNAAVIHSSHALTEDGIERTLQVNTLSPMALTFLLLDQLKACNGRVINVSAKLNAVWKKDADYYNQIDVKYTPPNYGISQYSYSKLGNIYFTQYLNEYSINNNLNIITASLHPGVIKTELTKDYSDIFLNIVKILIYPFFWFFTKNMEMGIQTTLHLSYISESEFKSGEYYSDLRVQELNEYGKNKDIRNAFIKLAKRYLSLHDELYRLVEKHL